MLILKTLTRAPLHGYGIALSIKRLSDDVLTVEEVAYSVSQRTREIGVRMALGAQRSSVYKMVMRQACWLTVAGVAIGLVCAVGVSLLGRDLLFGVEAWDAGTLAGVAVVLGGASLAASFLPAWRAASVNPTEALRAE